MFQNYGNTRIINAEIIDTIIPSSFFSCYEILLFSASLFQKSEFKNSSAYTSKQEHHTVNHMIF